MRAKSPINLKKSRKLSSIDLTKWLAQQLAPGTAQVQVRLRGNILHVLCETPRSLPQVSALTRLVAGLIEEPGCEVLRDRYPQVYQLYVYSRCQGSAQPDWTAPIYLNRLERHQAQLRLQVQDPAEVAAARSQLQDPASPLPTSWQKDGTTAAIVLSNLSLARQGKPEAIAWYLSEVLSTLDVGVWVSIRAVPGTANRPPNRPMASEQAAKPPGMPRLWILCEAAYSPDPMMIAEPVTERLRQLELTQFKDAVLVIQVQGERSPDWSLRIDLTPPREMLADWARWGDSGAIARLLNQDLEPLRLTASLEHKDTSLHLIVQTVQGNHQATPDEGVALQVIQPLLERLAPQGLHRAMIYGQRPQASTPGWVRCLNLPAIDHTALAPTPQTLAQQGDLPALTYLLTRRLNPDLEAQLATGGTRIQILKRGSLLHIMADAPTCPTRRQVVPRVLDTLQTLKISGIKGVRLYGRRAGQQRPAWSYGTDFEARPRLVPQAEPSFAASDAYVGDLLSYPEDGGLRPDLTPEEVRKTLTTWRQQTLDMLRLLLVKSQLFVPHDELPRTLLPLPKAERRDAFKVGIVWALVGLVLSFQVDWVLGQVMNPQSQQVAADAAELPPPAGGDRDDFDSLLSDLEWGNESANDNFRDEGFTEDGFTGDQRDRDPWEDTGRSLEASPDQSLAPTPALLESSPYASFRSQQLDEKLALYHQRVQESGPPDVLIIGSSRALRGVDPAALRQELAALGFGTLDIFNFGVNGSTAQVVDLTLRRILEVDQLPRLILWADGARAFNSGRVDVTYNGIATSEGYRELDRRRPEVPAEAPTATEDVPQILTLDASLRSGYQDMDRLLSERLGEFSAVYDGRDRLKAIVRDSILVPAVAPLTFPLAIQGETRQTSEMPLPENSRIDFDGFLALDLRFNPATYYQLYARVSGAYDSDYKDFVLGGQQAQALERLLEFTQSQGVPVAFINTPLTDEYLDTYRMEAEREFQRFMLQLSTSQSGFIFRDLGQIWPDRYDYFSDPSHLNRYGAYQVSNRIAQDPMIPWPTALDAAPNP
ncbi:MAG: DUF1574 domain-containing protein [Leptolyngbyaceae cyanobacterium T60_A2020_046]|nr:DUF1574 domain-containing protein [Leptolyngbyaceae cyanobacterium T60_A2020_046]